MDKKISIKNYVVYGIIVIVSLLLAFYLNEWFKAYKQNELENSFISQYIKEVNYDEFQTYITENPNIFVYIGQKNCEECIHFEKQLNKVINKYNLQEEFVFLNMSDNFERLAELKKNYYIGEIKSDIDNLPAVAIVKDKKIIDIVIDNNNNPISADDVVQLLEEYEYIG